MNIAEITWQTSNPVASEDEVINEIREAIARRGHQVGDCMSEAEANGEVAIPLPFELCTDDVPEVVEYESA